MMSVNPIISDLKAIDTPTLSNAIELLDIRDRAEGYCDYRLRCLFPQLGTMVGHAVTATADSSDPHRASPEGIVRLFEALERSPKPAVMVFQEVGNRPTFGCHCGEVMATIAKRLDCVGVVSDAGVRDVDEVLALGIQYFAAGVVASHGHFGVVDIGVPVEIYGLPIDPGDLLHGDANGLVKLPRNALPDLVKGAAKIRAREKEMLDFARSPSFSAAGLHDVFIAH
jgi:4-hydroxy-4-methyl-2-oxoglutarate aldolase